MAGLELRGELREEDGWTRVAGRVAGWTRVAGRGMAGLELRGELREGGWEMIANAIHFLLAMG